MLLLLILALAGRAAARCPYQETNFYDLCPVVNCSTVANECLDEPANCSAFTTVRINYDTDALSGCLSNILYVDDLYVTATGGAAYPDFMRSVVFVNNDLSIVATSDVGLRSLLSVGGDAYIKGNYDTLLYFWGTEVVGVLSIDYEDERKICSRARVGELVSEKCAWNTDSEYDNEICCSSAERAAPAILLTLVIAAIIVML